MTSLKKLLFNLLLIASQLCFTSEQSNQDITITRLTSPYNGQLIVTYSYNNPSSILLSSTVYLHADGSHTTHDIQRDGLSRTSYTNANGLMRFEPLHRTRPINSIVPPSQTILAAAQSIGSNEQLRENLPPQPTRATLISPTGFPSSLRPVPLTRQLVTSDRSLINSTREREENSQVPHERSELEERLYAFFERSILAPRQNIHIESESPRSSRSVSPMDIARDNEPEDNRANRRPR